MNTISHIQGDHASLGHAFPRDKNADTAFGTDSWNTKILFIVLNDTDIIGFRILSQKCAIYCHIEPEYRMNGYWWESFQQLVHSKQVESVFLPEPYLQSKIMEHWNLRIVTLSNGRQVYKLE